MTGIENLNQVARAVHNLAEQNQSAIEMAVEVANSTAVKTLQTLIENLAIKDVERMRTLMYSFESPLAGLHRTGQFEFHSQLQKEINKSQRMMAELQSRFERPGISAAAKLIREFQQSPMVGVLARYAEQASKIQKAMEAMHSPWLDMQQTLQSVSGFAGIQCIGEVLSRMPAFDEKVAAALRIDLGDWRDKISWTDPVLTDWSARSDFYEDLGFDPLLTNFPSKAFQESTEIAGLRREPPPLVVMYGEPVPRTGGNAEEEAFFRTNTAHDWLQRLESNLRRFIDSRMTATCGPSWPKHRLPNGMFERWKQKQTTAVKAGTQTNPLVAYADFTDYELVICKRDNWKEVFCEYFSRPENVRESFQRLNPIRLDTMHARPIGQDDQLLLYVEVKRLIRIVTG